MNRDVDFNAHRPDGEPTPDRWAAALSLFDAPGAKESAADVWRRAAVYFEGKDYATAARLLAGIVEEHPELTGPRLLLARAYYHSAQLRRAEEQLRELVDRDPVESYAHLMLARTLQRQGRDEEAARWQRLADALSPS
ncbi:tetratricopeptide repeat protein [Streptomyces sp. NPDC051940]|uniref:tetratricopeptide repeat protein n=1 Tax=Streptomyces sp. NPDC051940 TaxID=3155675 RepID=UPI00342C6552